MSKPEHPMHDIYVVLHLSEASKTLSIANLIEIEHLNLEIDDTIEDVNIAMGTIRVATRKPTEFINDCRLELEWDHFSKIEILIDPDS